MDKRKAVNVVAALISDTKAGRILICQRPANKDRALLWEFPGGKTEAGETGREALIRECMEELGIKIAPGEIYMSLTHEYPDIKINLSLYKAVIEEGTPEKLEHNDIKWVYPADVLKYDFCPADREIIQRLAEDFK